MWRANDLPGAVLVYVATLAALLSGCTQRDPPSDSRARAAFDNTAIASKDLPEIVITAPRPRTRTIVSSAREAGVVPR
jgi:type IV pilus biogenesis protein CpaD/CtpE